MIIMGMDILHANTLEFLHSKILVVDDMESNVRLLSVVLKKYYPNIMTASNGVEAIKIATQTPPDIILLDLMMPDMDGIEVCLELKKNPTTAQIPVIFLSAIGETKQIVAGFEAGAVDYLVKPYQATELLARVKTHLLMQHLQNRLQDLNSEKDSFLGMVAHDLRGPLSIITGYAELLLFQKNIDAQKRESYLQSILSQTHRMSEMMKNLLDINAIENGKLNLDVKRHSLKEIIASSIEHQKGYALMKKQVIQQEMPEEEVFIETDRNRFLQIVENLVSNAVKYSPPGKTVWIRLKNTAENLRLEIQDEGPGLNEEDKKHLFQKFARLSTKTTAGEPSIGLGLSIVKKLVDTMGGKIWCETELGKGCLFVLSFGRNS